MKALAIPAHGVDLAILGLAGALSLYSMATRSFFLSGSVLTATVVAPLLAFALTYSSLKARGVGGERVFVGLASVISGLILFEVVYHYGFPGAWGNLPSDLVYLNIFPANLSDGLPFPVLFYSMIVAMPFTAYRFMRPNRLFALLLFGALATFAAWEGLGYPQWSSPGSDAATAMALNSAAKLFVLTLPASLFYQGRAGDNRGILGSSGASA